MSHSTAPSSGYKGLPPHYLNRNDPERRPRSSDPSVPPGYPSQSRLHYLRHLVEGDGIGSLGAFIGFQPEKPVFVSLRTRKRVVRIQILSVLGILVLLGIWFFWRYINRGDSLEFVYQGDIVSCVFFFLFGTRTVLNEPLISHNSF